MHYFECSALYATLTFLDIYWLYDDMLINLPCSGRYWWANDFVYSICETFPASRHAVARSACSRYIDAYLQIVLSLTSN